MNADVIKERGHFESSSDFRRPKSLINIQVYGRSTGPPARTARTW
jgi:hypothetical protein